MSAVGVGRPGWAAAPYDLAYHHQTTLSSGKTKAVCASKVHQQASTSGSEGNTSALVSRLAAAQTSGAAGFVGFCSAPPAERPGRLGRRRFGRPSGDCCRTSVCNAVGRRFKQEKRVVRARAGTGATDGPRSDGGAGDEAGSSSVWDLPARHRRIQEAAAKVGDPFRDMMTNASKKLQDYLDNIKSSRSKDQRGVQKTESAWEKWQKVFAEVDDRERLVSVLKFQLEEAVDKEDFQEAAKLKQTIASASANDTLSEVMNGLQSALAEERYNDAARLRDEAGAGLVGWWVGLAEGGNDPYGRIIHIAASEGRFIAKSYSARQLATAASGMPLFEVFVQKDAGNNFSKQAVYLQRDGNVATDAATGHSIKDFDPSGQRSKDGSKADAKSASPEKSENSPKNAEDFIDEGINNIISFLKDRMPDVRLKVLQVIAPDGVESDIPKLVEQLMDAEENEEATKDSETEVSGNGEASVVEQPEQNKTPFGGSTGSNSGEERQAPVRLVIGGVLQSNDSDRVPRAPLRVPANVEHKNKDEFVFHIEDTGTASSSASTSSPTKEALPSWKVATIATQPSTDVVTDDVAKVLWNVEKVPVKVSKEMGEIIRLAVSQAQRRRGLSKSTSFRRVIVSNSGTDPLSGLYIGAFGPYTSEVVQLRRKYGQWQGDEASTKPEKLEFFEYVEAIKLTGDLNVPAGQVTFRAKIGRESRLSLRGAYPEELGVVGRYKGQGRLAEPGFRNPQWIDGEMVLLDGKQGGGHTNGAELGFVYSVPERHFLVLFNRLKLRD